MVSTHPFTQFIQDSKILKMFCNTPLRSLRDDATCVRMFSSGSHKTLTGLTFAQICFLTEPTQRLSLALFAFSAIRLELVVADTLVF